MTDEQKSTEEKDQYGIDETMDVLEFAEAYVEGLKEHKADDGKIDSGELLETIADNKMATMKAAMGSWNIPKELGDLSAEEKDKLLEKSLQIALKVGELAMTNGGSKTE